MDIRCSVRSRNIFSIFTGTAQDIYIHWLIVGMGIAVLVCVLAVFFSCRTFTLRSMLSGKTPGFFGRIYAFFLRFHTYYWTAFLVLLLLHLMVTITHTGIPTAGDPYVTSHRFVFVTAIINFVIALVVFSSCKSFLVVTRFVSNLNPLHSTRFQKFYKLHPYLWALLIISLCIHIVAGMIHAINT